MPGMLILVPEQGLQNDQLSPQFCQFSLTGNLVLKAEGAEIFDKGQPLDANIVE